MLASYPHSRATSSTAAIYGGNRRRGGAIAHRDGGIIHGGGRIGRTGGYLGPFMRRLTPQVVAQAGRPHCHLSGPAAHQWVKAASKGARAHSSSPARTAPGPRAQLQPRAHAPARAHTPRHTPTSAVTCTSGNTKTPEPQQVPGSGGGGWGIRTPEGLHPTRFPSVRHRPLGESSVHIVPDNHKQETPLSANPGQWSRSQMGVRAFTRRR